MKDTGVEYHWIEKLGGRRRKQQGESVNVGLRNEAFRNYADYKLTDEFQEGVAELLRVARKKRLTLICAEGLFLAVSSAVGE